MTATDALLGTWILDPADREAHRKYGDTRMEFMPDGMLKYCIRKGGSEHIVLLTYRTEGDALITNQPSQPREERTVFALDQAGRLVLEFGGIKATYLKRAS